MNKDFEQIFKPMFCLTTMCCGKKICLKNHNISYINKRHNIISVLSIIGILIVYYFAVNEFVLYSVSPIMFYLYVLSYLLYVIDHIILKFVNFVQRKNNVALFSALQNIYRHLSLKKQLTKIKLQLILPCTVTISGYLTLIVYKIALDLSWSLTRGLFIFSTVILDLELIYSGFILIFLSNKIKTWTNILRNIDERINNYKAVVKKMDNAFHMLMDAVIFNKNSFKSTVIKCNLSTMSNIA